MPSEPHFIDSAGRRCRTVAATLIAALWPGRDVDDVERRLSGLPLRQQCGVVVGVLGMLFLASLFAAQFGLLGMALFFLLVVLMVA